MSVPREVVLRTVDGRPQLVQAPVASVDTLLTGVPHTESGSITGERTLAVRGDVLDIRATLRPGSATRFGLKVLGNTAIGYDVARGELYVDRTNAGPAAGLANFNGVQTAPVKLRDGRLNLRILVDRSLVEVFAQGGERTIADQIYTTPGADGLKVFAEGGTAELESLEVRQLRSTWGALQTTAPGGVGGIVSPTLSLTLGAPASFGAFQPGVAREYTASTTANVISTAGDAALTRLGAGPSRQRRVHPARAAARGHRAGVLGRAGVQRDRGDRVQAADQGHRRAADRELHPNADVHAVDHESLGDRRELSAAPDDQGRGELDPPRRAVVAVEPREQQLGGRCGRSPGRPGRRR